MTPPVQPEPSIGEIEGGDRAAEAAVTKTLAQNIAAAVANSAAKEPGSSEVTPVLDPNAPIPTLWQIPAIPR